MNLSSPLTLPYNRRTREESLFRKGSSAGAIFSPKIASLRFQTSQHKGQKIHDSSRTFQSKIHPNGPELALEENQNPTVFERLECVARFITHTCTQRFLVPVSRVPARNAWHNDLPVCVLKTTKNSGEYFQKNWEGTNKVGSSICETFFYIHSHTLWSQAQNKI